MTLFMKDWHDWYRGLMPGWRYADITGNTKWPLKRVVPDGEDWSEVRKGERNGILVIIMTLWWWKAVSENRPDIRAKYISAREDFAWLLTRLVICDTPPSAARPSRKRNINDDVEVAVSASSPSRPPARKQKRTGATKKAAEDASPAPEKRATRSSTASVPADRSRRSARK